MRRGKSNFWSDVLARFDSFRGGEPINVVAPAVAIMISVVSGYTTFLGFTHLVPGLLFALVITIAVQLALFYTSDAMGEALALKKPPRRSMLTVFILSLVFSVTFSYVTFFDQIFDDDSRQIDRTINARTVAEQVRDGAREALESNRNATRDALRNNTDFTDFADRMRGAASAVQSNWDTIQRESQRLRQEMAKRAANASAQLENAKNDQVNSRNQIDTDTMRLEQLQITVNQANQRLAQAQNEVVKYQTEEAEWLKKAELEEAQGLEGRIAGCGPVCRDFKRQALSASQERTLAESRRDQAQQSAETAQAQIRAAQQRITNARAKLAELDALLPTLESGGTPTANLGSGPDIVELAPPEDPAALGRDLAEFENRPTLVALESLEATCQALAQVQARTASTGPALDCEVGPLRSAISEANESAVKLAEFEAAVIGANPSSMTYEEALSFGSEAIRAAKLSATESAPLSKQIGELQLLRSDQANMFTISWTAMIKDRTPLAFLAFTFALFVDLLITMVSFLRQSQIARPENQATRMLESMPENLGESTVESRRRVIEILNASISTQGEKIVFDFAEIEDDEDLAVTDKELKAVRGYLVGSLRHIVGGVRPLDKDAFTAPEDIQVVLAKARAELSLNEEAPPKSSHSATEDRPSAARQRTRDYAAPFDPAPILADRAGETASAKVASLDRQKQVHTTRDTFPRMTTAQSRREVSRAGSEATTTEMQSEQPFRAVASEQEHSPEPSVAPSPAEADNLMDFLKVRTSPNKKAGKPTPQRARSRAVRDSLDNY